MIEGSGTAIVLDFGTGACANLTAWRAPDTIDAIVISHMHADHFLDIVTLRYALKYGRRTNGRRVKVFLPPTGEAMLRGIAQQFAPESSGDFLAETLDIACYDPRSTLEVGAARVRFAATAHFIPTYAMRCEFGGAAVVYSADSAPAPGLEALARECDLLLCEATIRPGEPQDGIRGHMSAREAGELAHAAGARQLALTHYPDDLDAAGLGREAARAFAGPISVVDDGDQLIVGLGGAARERKLDE